MNNGRKFLPSLADLIDSLSIDQIKEIKLPNKGKIYSQEMVDIANDIDLLIKEGKLHLSARLIRIIIIISQINLFIWNNKDKMQESPDHYNESLKQAHQLNGIRNRMKNLILEEIEGAKESRKRTNTETDGLEGWDISLK